MAVAAPKRRTASAPPPSRTTPPPRRKAAAPATAPRRKSAPAKAPAKRAPAKAPAKRAARHSPRARVAAPARQAPARKAPARKPSSRKATARKATAGRTAARTAPSRARTTAQSARAVGGQLIPLAGRTAVAVGQLPDSGLVVRLTRGRAWIAVLGALLAGIVALNVVTLSFAASAGRIDEQITLLDQEVSVMNSKVARVSGIGPVRNAAASLGLTMPASDEIHFTDAGPENVATAAQRLAAASP